MTDWVVGMQVLAARSEPPPPKVCEGWFLAYTNERAEQRAAHALRRSGIVTHLFTERVRRKVRGRIVDADLALFPRYLFVGLAADDFFRLRGTPGLEAIVRGASGYPTRVADALVTGLAARQRQGDFDHTGRDVSPTRAPPRGHKPGDAVEVVAGPYRQFVVTVDTMLPAARVRVLLNLFGRHCPMEMPLDDLAQAG